MTQALFIIPQSSSFYLYVAQAHTAIPVSLLSDYQGISQQTRQHLSTGRTSMMLFLR